MCGCDLDWKPQFFLRVGVDHPSKRAETLFGVHSFGRVQLSSSEGANVRPLFEVLCEVNPRGAFPILSRDPNLSRNPPETQGKRPAVEKKYVLTKMGESF